MREEEYHVPRKKICQNEGDGPCVDSNGHDKLVDGVNNQVYTTQPRSGMLGNFPEEHFVFVCHEDFKMLVSHTGADMAKVTSKE